MNAIKVGIVYYTIKNIFKKKHSAELRQIGHSYCPIHSNSVAQAPQQTK